MTRAGKPSASADTYMYALLAERMLGRPLVEYVSTWMDRGSALEAEAVDFYSFTRDQETVKVGFILNEAGTIGASPDRLVGDDGLMEIKVPKESTHVGYLLGKPIDQEYKQQVNGQLWIAERQWLDVLSYCPELPPALIRVERDEDFITILHDAVWAFSDKLEELARELTDRGWIKEAIGDAAQSMA